MPPTWCHASHGLLIAEEGQALSGEPVGKAGLTEYRAAPKDFSVLLIKMANLTRHQINNGT